MYMVSTMKRPDFGNVLNIGKWSKGPMRTTGVHFSAQICKLPHGPPLGHTDSAHVECTDFLNYGCCVVWLIFVNDSAISPFLTS
jgi:hypothetical protein